MRRLVLLGGGHAHAHVLKAIGDAPDPAVRVTLVTPVERQLYSGMVPGFVAGHYTLDECVIDLAQLARRARAIVVRSPAARVDPSAREVRCASGEVVPYDVLGIDVGSRPVAGKVKGVAEHAVPIRPLEGFLEGWGRALGRAKAGAIDAVSIVGGGAAGVELAFAMEHRFRREAGDGAVHVRLLTDSPTVIPECPVGARARLVRLARLRNIGLHPESPVSEVGAGFLRVKDRVEFATGATFWVTGAASLAFIRDSGLGTDDDGFLVVNDCLQSVTHPEVFGAGDCATHPEHPRPKAGVFAVRAGAVLTANLLAALQGGALQRNIASRRFLALISCGDRYAVGLRGPFSFEGAWVWRWKDRIDRRFLARYAPEAPARHT